MREKNILYLNALKKIDEGNFSIAGRDNKKIWEDGWQENLDNFIKRNKKHYLQI